MKKTLKRLTVMMALLAVPFAMQAQSKFHDAEANEAKGAVKVIKQTVMGRTEEVKFTEDGKMQREGMSDAVYDADGFLKSASVEAMGQKGTIAYTWENGRLKTTVANMMGQEIKSVYNYDAQGNVTSTSVNMAGQQLEIPFTDYKFDDKGNCDDGPDHRADPYYRVLLSRCCP